MTLQQEGATGKKLLSYETDRIGVLKFVSFEFVSSVEKRRRGGGLKVVFIAVEVLPVGGKPPAADFVRISKRERHDLGAAAPFSTTTSSLQRRAGGLAFTPKLIEVFGPS